MVKICLALPPAVFIKLNFKAYYESVMMVKNHLIYYMLLFYSDRHNASEASGPQK